MADFQQICHPHILPKSRKPTFKYHVYDVELADTGDFILNIDVAGLCKVICMAATYFYNSTPDKSRFKDSMIAYIEEGAENGK